MDIITHPNVVLIMGMRNSGKTALAFLLIEDLHNRTNIPVYVLNFPEDKRHLLPKWINFADDIRDVPENSIVLMDEASHALHSLKWRKNDTIIMQKFLGISRQRKLTVIFVSHVARKFAINILLEIDVLFAKEPSLFHSKFERYEIRGILKEVYDAFQDISRENRQRYSYVYSKDYLGLVQSGLCSFWSNDLSEAWKDVFAIEDEDSQLGKL